MRLIATSPSQAESARDLDDRNVLDQIYYTGIMLSTVLRENGCGHRDLMRPAYRWHGATVWTGTSRGNWEWVHRYFLALCSEKAVRWPGNPSHELYSRLSGILPWLAREHLRCLPSLLTPFPQDQHRRSRRALTEEWLTSEPRWTRRGPPWFYPWFHLDRGPHGAPEQLEFRL